MRNISERLSLPVVIDQRVSLALEWFHVVLGVSHKLKPFVLDVVGPVVR